MEWGNVKVVVAHKKSAAIFLFNPRETKKRYLFDPPRRVGITYSHSYPWASPMAMHGLIRYRGSNPTESKIIAMG